MVNDDTARGGAMYDLYVTVFIGSYHRYMKNATGAAKKDQVTWLGFFELHRFALLGLVARTSADANIELAQDMRRKAGTVKSIGRRATIFIVDAYVLFGVGDNFSS